MRLRDVDSQMLYLGHDLNSTDFLILRTIIQLSSEREVSFKDIKQSIETQQPSSISRVWIYKVLKKLENEGFIETVEFPAPTKYRSDYYIINDALEKRKKRVIDNLTLEEQKIKETITFLENIKPSAVGFNLYNMLTRDAIESSPLIVYGYDNIMHLVRNKIMAQAGPGDIIRICKRLEKGTSGKHKSDPTIDHAYQALAGGTNIKMLIHLRENQTEWLLNARLFSDKSRLSLERYRNAEFRFLVDYPPTYMMISLNESRVVIFLNTSAQHNFASLITREQNRFLVNDAISVFDKHWEQALTREAFVKKYSKLYGT